jgi:nitrate reductase gamma subunit
MPRSGLYIYPKNKTGAFAEIRSIVAMKKLAISFVLTVLINLLAVAADGSWLIDTERFHISVHGHLSCQDCHSDISEKLRHPDPADVYKSLKDFFHPNQCLECHENVSDEIEEGSHAGEPVRAWQRFDDCLGCHSPHYQTSYAENSIQPDLKLPPNEKCSLCHEFQAALPEFSAEDQECLNCHRSIPADDPQAALKTANLCFDCHSSANRYADQIVVPYPVINANAYASTPHAKIACLACHPRAAEFKHTDQTIGSCAQCHWPHAEKVAHDMHAIVTCGACHLSDVTPIKQFKSGAIGWQKKRQPDNISTIHHMVRPEKDASCRGCHASNNSLGAAAMVLPAKSIICMPCHAATFTVGDTTTILTLFLFLIGLIGVGSMWLSGGNSTATASHKIFESLQAVLKAVFSIRFIAIAKSLLMDGLLQRRLFKVSRERWVLHAIIFYPFVFRFVWGMIGLIASLWWPQWPGTWAMLDKNNPLTAFLFDLSGFMVIIGVIGVLIRRQQNRSADSVSGLPTADWPAYALLGGIIMVGFILEGMRMTMTQSPQGAPYAFIGDAISRMLAGSELTAVYGYVWYLHAILTGAFVVYLPFSRMFHMIMAPVNMAINAAAKPHR